MPRPVVLILLCSETVETQVGNRASGYTQQSPRETFLTIEQQVVEKLRGLPPEKQKEVLDFVGFLKEKSVGPKKPSAARWAYGPTSTSTSRKKTSPKPAAKCGATSRATSNYERSSGYSHRPLVFGEL
jgi:hypothetical protein